MMEVRLYQATLCCRSLYDGMFELKTRTYMIMKSKDLLRNGRNTSDLPGGEDSIIIITLQKRITL